MDSDMFLKIAPIVISCIALFVSLMTVYFQWFRHSLKGKINVLSISWRRQIKENTIQLPIEISISNQGNKPFIISKVWLLHKVIGEHKRYLECDDLNGMNPLKVMPNSVELKHLIFSQSYQEFHNDLKLHDGSYIEILFYIIDDKGNESYLSLKPAIIAVVDEEIKNFEFEPVSATIFNGSNKNIQPTAFSGS